MPTEGAYRKIGNGRPMIAPTDLYGKRTSTSFLPPLRHCVPPLLKERYFVRLPLRGAVGNAD